MPDLIVNADDFGRSPGITRGILEAHQRGIVTSATVMVNMPDAPDAIQAALETAPDLGLGVHLTLTSGRPALPPEDVPSLVTPDGTFRSINVLWGDGPGWDGADVARELRAQVERFGALSGRPPTHLDAHQHAAYLHPDALRALLALAAEYDLPVRRPALGMTQVYSQTTIERLLPGVTPEAASRLAADLHAVLADAPPFRAPAYLSTTFYGPTAIMGELFVILTNLPRDGVTELMCHPGYADGLASSYTAGRERELRLLTHPSTHEVIADLGITLLSYAELA
ncbi:MAG: ChbG/HpnK family deacetylase [Anaerolineae bacterium]|nr:ChbG/HpnK family deacetylase [Anaerolineae bacterium]